MCAGQASADIEITPEIIEAGVTAYLECDREFDSYEQIISNVFQAMTEASHAPNRAVSLSRQSSEIPLQGQTEVFQRPLGHLRASLFCSRQQGRGDS